LVTAARLAVGGGAEGRGCFWCFWCGGREGVAIKALRQRSGLRVRGVALSVVEG